MTGWQSLCAHFEIGQPVDIRSAGGTRNRNFILQTDVGKWFVRGRHPDYCDEKRILFDHAAAVFWNEHGAPVIAPRPARDGRTYKQEDAGVWEVYPYVSGRQLRDGDESDILALARSLAAVHESGRSFSLRYKKAAPRGETDPGRLMSRIVRMQSEGKVDEDTVEPYRDSVGWAESNLTSDMFLALPSTLVHGDLQPANILVEGKRIAALVDLDWCMWLPRIYDLTTAILCCCAEHDVPFDGGDIWSITQPPRLARSLVHGFLDEYQHRGTPLASEERNALLPQLILTWCAIRIDGAFKVPAEERTTFLRREPTDIQRCLAEAL